MRPKAENGTICPAALRTNQRSRSPGSIRDAASPCDDRLPVREDTSRPFADPKSDVARPDGSHFAPAAATKVATVLLGRVLAAADVARG